MEKKKEKYIYPSDQFVKENLIQNGYSVFRLKNDQLLEESKIAYDFTMQYLSSDINPNPAFKNLEGISRHFQYPHLSNQIFVNIIFNVCKSFINEVFNSQRLYVTHSKISYKHPGKEVPWYPHQDNGYKLYNGLIPRKGITVGIFLEDANDNNGTLQFFPKSHLEKTLPHKYVVEDPKTNLGQVVLSQKPSGYPYSVIAKRGDIAVWSLDTIHQSQSNRSEGYRCIFLFEVEPFQELKADERGKIPIVLNTRLSLSEKIWIQTIGIPARINYFLNNNGIIRKVYKKLKGYSNVD